MTERYWAVAQTVSTMEHIVRRGIEKTNHGAFLPTCARIRKVDDREYVKERPLLGGYVFFNTAEDDWAGIPDIHGVYRVLSNPNGSAKRVCEQEMFRLVVGHAAGDHDITHEPRYTRFYKPDPTKRKHKPGRRSRPRRSKSMRAPRSHPDMQITDDHALQEPQR